MINFRNYLYKLFTLKIYLRTILESNQFLLIWWVYEINLMGKSSASRYFSLVCAFILYIIWIKFTSIIGYVTIKVIRDSQWRLIYYFEEVFSGVRNTKFAKLYTIIRSLRTTLFVTFLLFWENTWIITKIAVLAVFQILYLAIMIFVQPIEQIKERILNIINEILFFWLAIILIKYNSVSSWTNSAQSGFIWSITATNMLAWAIYISKNWT